MKSIVRNVAIIGGLLMATASFAQVKATQGQSGSIKQSERPKDQQEGSYILSAEQMTQDLGLTKDQSEKMLSIESSINNRIRSLEKLDPKERNEKEEALMAERSKMVSSVLTPEQNKKLEVITQKMMKERQSQKVQPVR